LNPALTSCFTVRGAKIVYDSHKQEIAVNSIAPLLHCATESKTDHLLRQNGLEVFASDGLTYIPMPFIPRSEDRTLAVQARRGQIVA
jgi:levanase/fructan beta-fructosidase